MMIAFVGFKASGKNTAAAALYPYGYVPLSFADALKDSLAAIFCWDRELLEGITDESRAWREQVDPWWAEKLGIPGFTPRWALQNIATEVIRRHLHNDIWVMNVERRLSLIDAPVVLVDCRFPNEIALAHRYGGRVIRIQRGPEPSWNGLAIVANHHPVQGIREGAVRLLDGKGVHPSEYAWIGSEIDDTIVNDGTIAELHETVVQRLICAA